jgi:hypothetical protein
MPAFLPICLLVVYFIQPSHLNRFQAAFICTPHACHLENTRDCLLAGMDVLLEKPMG